MVAEELLSRHDLQISTCEEEITALMKSRARFRAASIVFFVFFALLSLFFASSPSRDDQGTCCRPRIILLVVPHLHPGMLEAAMASNKAPFLGFVSTVHGSYARLRAESTDLTGSLVTILTGSVSPGAASLAGKTSFLGRLKHAGKKPVVLAPPLYWSTKGPGGDDSCSSVGLLDAECLGFSCPQATQTAYCNAVEKLLACKGKAQLYNEDAVEAFSRLIQKDGDILYAHVDFAAGTVASDEERLALLSDISVMDGMLGKLALAAQERSRTTSESWLLMVVGAGDGRLEKVPLVMAAYTKGGPVRLGAIPENATLADISPTVLHWYGLSSSSDSQRVRGMCSTGITVENCTSAVEQLQINK